MTHTLDLIIQAYQDDALVHLTSDRESAFVWRRPSLREREVHEAYLEQAAEDHERIRDYGLVTYNIGWEARDLYPRERREEREKYVRNAYYNCCDLTLTDKPRPGCRPVGIDFAYDVKGEPVYLKRTRSPFVDGHLETCLKDRGVKAIAVSGMFSGTKEELLCVDCTILHALQASFDVCAITDMIQGRETGSADRDVRAAYCEAHYDQIDDFRSQPGRLVRATSGEFFACLEASRAVLRSTGHGSILAV